MAVKLTTNAVEKSSYIVTVSFTDENNAAVTPNSVTWTLTDTAGTVINSRSAVSITAGTTSYIVMTGNDLEIFATESAAAGYQGHVERRLLIQAPYDTTIGGSPYTLANNVEYAFNVYDTAALANS